MFMAQVIVFPTPVGVFLFKKITFISEVCLPHARGGVSQGDLLELSLRMSSPRPWGCFSDKLRI